MKENEESINDMIDRVRKFATIDGATLLQVDATAIVGVLFFLTLTTFVEFGSEEEARANIAILTRCKDQMNKDCKKK
jgi:hypothetical protein